jgi:hypothetical protein
MTLPPSIRINPLVPFPAQVTGKGVVAVAKNNGIWAVSLNFTGLVQQNVLTDPENTFALVWNAVSGVFSLLRVPTLSSAANKITRVVATPGPITASPADDVIIVKQAVAAPMIINVDWSQRTTPLRVVDGKGDASINNITIIPAAGQTQLAVVNFQYVIDGNGGSITLTPLPDGSGAY